MRVVCRAEYHPVNVNRLPPRGKQPRQGAAATDLDIVGVCSQTEDRAGVLE